MLGAVQASENKLQALLIEKRAKTMKEVILTKSNAYRAKHHAGALTWDTTLQGVAEGWAQHMASTEKFEHSSSAADAGYGENLYYASGWPEKKVPGLAVDKWYNEIKDYDFNNAKFSHNTGHFTQLVWKDTTHVGCGYAKSEGGKMYICCNYNPAGNWQGEYAANVLPA